MRISGFLLLATALVLIGCGSDQEPAHPKIIPEAPLQPEGHTGQGIQWFDGSIEDAFATAKAGNKPVFLYWGAQWCPPCQELKATIFRRDEFIAQSRLFVPVYLDGDTERAQKYGEQFGVEGYPTVIIFDPQGIEITRIPGGMNIEQYLGVLELALNALHPVKDLLKAVQAGQEIRDDDWRLLASYSWGQDRGRALGEGSGSMALQVLAEACPDRLSVAKSKLQMWAIYTWASEKDPDVSIATTYADQIQHILSDKVLSRENLTVIIAGGANVVKAMSNEEQRVAVRNGIAAMLADAVQDQSIGVLTRIDAIYGWVAVTRTSPGEGEQLSADQQDWVKAQAAAARARVDHYQQHAALSTLSQTYLDAGLVAEARAAMQEGIEVSKQPYYFMSGMAYLETEAGNTQDAIAWHKKAWEAAQGPATRVQWGTSYMFALIKLRPDDIEAINLAGESILAELAQQQDGLYQRNSGRMDRLSRTLLTWSDPAEADAATSQQRHLVLINLREKMDKLCAGIATNRDASATCNSFLVPAS